MSSIAIKDYPRATFSGFAKRLRPIQEDITYDKYMGFFLRSKYFRKIKPLYEAMVGAHAERRDNRRPSRI